MNRILGLSLLEGGSMASLWWLLHKFIVYTSLQKFGDDSSHLWLHHCPFAPLNVGLPKCLELGLPPYLEVDDRILRAAMQYSEGYGCGHDAGMRSLSEMSPS